MHVYLYILYYIYIYIYNEQTNAHLIGSLLYFSLFIGPTRFIANGSSSGSSYSLPAELHKRVHAVLVVFFKETFTFVFLELLNIKTVLAVVNCIVVQF
jgi:hypothetical protein